MKLQFITHHNDRYNYVDSVWLALKGGCRWIQLRMKETPKPEFVETAREVAQMCHAYGATLILDDHVDLVEEVGADGVHLGSQDMPVDLARELLGPDKIIGGTANTIEDIRRLNVQKADYIGCGPFRFTTTKENLSPLLGLEGYRQLIAQMRQEGIDLPVVAIGGILREDIPAIMQTGVNGIALSGAILNAPNPKEETTKILEILSER